MILIGVDGGSKKSNLVACNEFGYVLGTETCGAVDFNTAGMYAARNELRNGVDNLLDTIGEDWCDFVSVGLSSLTSDVSEDVLEQFCGDLFETDRIRLRSKVANALLGASLGTPGIVCYSGKKCVTYGVDEAEREYLAGGWGSLLGEEGSGYDIALKVIQAAVRSSEGGKQTALAEMVTEWFGVDSMREIIPVLNSESFDPVMISDAARLADLGVDAGDEVSAEILRQSAESAARGVLAVTNLCGKLPVYKAGGVFTNSRVFNQEFQRAMKSLCPDITIRDGILSPEYGALISAAKYLGIDSREFRAELTKQ